MDELFRKTRLRFSGVGQEEKDEPKRGDDLRIPSQKTVSFKDTKKDQNWLQRRLSRQMSRDNDTSNIDEQAIAVAAAAYAIIALKEQELPQQKKTKDDSKTSTVTIKGKKEKTKISIPEHGRVSRKVSGEITKASENPDSKVPITAATDTKKPEKALFPTPSIKKTSLSFDKQLGGSFKHGGALNPELPSSSMKPSQIPSVDKQPKPSMPTTVKPGPEPAETRRQGSTRLWVGKSQADIWEETELAKITERYQEQKTTILSWEDKKKTKAKRQLNKEERELETKRAKAAEKFRKRIRTIDQVVGGAKAKAEEKKRNDEFKVKEKANIIRQTGKVPSTCACF